MPLSSIPPAAPVETAWWAAPIETSPPPPPKPFRLLDADDEAGGYLPDLAFETGREAAQHAQAERAKSGRKLRVVREVSPEDASAGRLREESRMMSGEYDRLPAWFPAAYRHYAHWAKDEAKRREGWIAYSPTDLHLAEDRQVIVPASRYLAKEFPGTRPEEISRLTQLLLATFAPVEFRVTRDPAIGRLAYIGNNHCAEASDYPSCMRYGSAEYSLPEGRHPCDAYFGPNSTLSLAYTHVVGEPGQIQARAIVSERHKFFVRVYGYDESARQTLLARLAEAGYSRRSSFEGERLHLEPHPRWRHDVVMPYLDGDAQCCDDDGYIDDDGELDCGVTNGRAERSGGRTRCEHCGERVRDAEGTSVGDEFWCDDCAGEYAVYCERYGEYVGGADSVEVDCGRHGIQTWCDDAADTHAFYCDNTETYYSAAIFTAIEVITARGSRLWCYERTQGEWRKDDDGDLWSVADFPETDDETGEEAPSAA